MTIHPKVIAL